MNGLIGFMSAGIGRAVRAVLGLAIVALGLFVVQGTAGLVLAVVGLVPLAMGVWGRCLLERIAPTAKPRHA